jgi:hypothetical protein
MDTDRRREVVAATLEALRHTVGRDEHMPSLKRLVEGQIGPVSVNRRERSRSTREVWEELIETVRRAAE